jgi:hypothetical protein
MPSGQQSNLAAIKFHSSKKVNFKTERNEPLNISINEIEKNYRRNSYQFVYSTNNKNNYTKFGFCPNAQNTNSKKIDYLSYPVVFWRSCFILDLLIGVCSFFDNLDFKGSGYFYGMVD